MIKSIIDQLNSFSSHDCEYGLMFSYDQWLDNDRPKLTENKHGTLYVADFIKQNNIEDISKFDENKNILTIDLNKFTECQLAQLKLIMS